MKSYFALVCILISCTIAVYGQSNSDEIQRLQKLVKENEERALRAEAAAKVAEEYAKCMRYLSVALELADRSVEIPDKEFSALLAVLAYNFNTQNCGYPFNSRVYSALFNSLKKYNLFSKNLKEYSQAIDSLIISTKSPIFSAVFPNGHYSVVAEQSGNLKFVTEDGTTVRILSEHRAQVDQIKFSHSGQLMATSGRDNAIRIWNLSQINQRPLVISHNDAIVKLEFSPDDEQIMYMLAKSDVVRMQPLDMKIMASELCKVLTRNLTKDEWAFYVGVDLDYELVCTELPPNNK